jgi:hypothetical protein
MNLVEGSLSDDEASCHEVMYRPFAAITGNNQDIGDAHPGDSRL